MLLFANALEIQEKEREGESEIEGKSECAHSWPARPLSEHSAWEGLAKQREQALWSLTSCEHASEYETSQAPSHTHILIDPHI